MTRPGLNTSSVSSLRPTFAGGTFSLPPAPPPDASDEPHPTELFSSTDPAPAPKKAPLAIRTSASIELSEKMAKFTQGAMVRLTGLKSKPQLNGTVGRVMPNPSPWPGTVKVQLESGEDSTLKLANLELLAGDAARAAAVALNQIASKSAAGGFSGGATGGFTGGGFGGAAAAAKRKRSRSRSKSRSESRRRRSRSRRRSRDGGRRDDDRRGGGARRDDGRGGGGRRSRSRSPRP